MQLLALLGLAASAAAANVIDGQWTWVADAANSSTLEMWDTVTLHIDTSGDSAVVSAEYEPYDIWTNSSGPLSGECVSNPVTTNVFVANPFMGLRFLNDSVQTTCADVSEDGATLLLKETYDVHGSTGLHGVTQTTTMAVDGDAMTVTIVRTSRDGATLTYAYARVSAASDDDGEADAAAALRRALRTAAAVPSRAQRPAAPSSARPPTPAALASSAGPFAMPLNDDWDIHGGLPEKALLLSLQGIANSVGDNPVPQVYFTYPDDWDFTYSGAFYDYMSTGRPDPSLNVPFTMLRDGATADMLRAVAPLLGKETIDYVIWDTDNRDSLPVAYTVSGIHKALVVTADSLQLLEAALASVDGVALATSAVVDLRGQFTGSSAVDTFQWAYDQYGNQTSKEYIVMLGGDAGPETYIHSCADFGVAKNAFFMDLSTDPEDTDMYALADTILGGQDKYSLMFGWHNYKYDLERTYTTLASKHTIRVEGLTTLPNFSFMTLKTIDPSFVFKNNKNVVKGVPADPAKAKTYVSCVQTDSLGLGSWLSPSRGTIPYAWETPLNYFWLAPVMLEYYYGSATPNDLMIAAISGAGYNYPKAIPTDDLPGFLDIAHNLTDALDIDIMETMDDSEGSTVMGNTDLTEAVVDAYFDAFPDFVGFIHGYAPSFTFAQSANDQPYISFDYYLSPTSTEDEVVADLLELSNINREAGDGGEPYFLLIHVREWSDISRVADVLAQLPASEFSVEPLDTFLSMAGQSPTFEPHYAPY